MVEKKLKVAVIAMMLVAGLYAFDGYYNSAGITGLVVNSAAGSYDCSDSDGNNPYVAGFTSSEIYENGYAEDACVGSDLLEFYCASGGPDVRAVSCPKGCFSGACG